MKKKIFVLALSVLVLSAMVLSACQPQEAVPVVEAEPETEAATPVVYRDASKVGIKVIDDYTLELTFKNPGIFNAAIAGMWMGYAQPSWSIEEKGDRWFEPGLIQTYGPYTLKDWVHDYEATLIKNPFWVGIEFHPEAKIDEVNFRFLDDTVALTEYEAGNVDVSAVPGEDMDRVKADAVMSAEYIQAPVFCSYYYGFNTSLEPVNDARVRRALSMAIDRQLLIDSVLKGAQQPARWVENPGLAGAPTVEEFPDAGIGFDADAAKAELQSYLDEKGVTAASLDITLLFNDTVGHKNIAEAIQAMWRDTLGIEVKLSAQEWKVYLETVDGPNAPQVFRLGWCQDYPDANNFTKELFGLCGNSNVCKEGAVYGGLQYLNTEYQDLLDQAALETNNDKRQELYVAAGNIIYRDDAAVVPIYWYGRQTLTKPYVTRTFGVGGQEYFDKWDIDMEAKQPGYSGSKLLNMTLGPGDIPTLDPSKAEDTSSIQMDILMFPGVTRPNEETSVVEPAMAVSWDVSEDGLVYTFKLRDDVYWVKYDEALDEVVQVLDDEGNPRMVTANDFYYGFIRTLKKETASPYAYILDMVLVGAEEFHYADPSPDE